MISRSAILLTLGLAALGGFLVGRLIPRPVAVAPAPSSHSAGASAPQPTPDFRRTRPDFAGRGDSARQRAELARWARSIPDGAWEEALGMAADLPAGNGRRELTAAIVGRWATRDPQAAYRWVQGEAAPAEMRAPLLSAVFRSWGATSPVEALAFAQAQEKELAGDRTTVIAAIFSGWSSDDPAAAARQLESLPAADRAEALGAVAVEWTMADPEAGVRWCLRVADREPAALIYAAHAISTTDGPEAAFSAMNAAWSRTESPTTRQAIARGLTMALERWTDEDPERALRAAGEVADPDLRRDAVGVIVARMAQQDPGGFLDRVTLPTAELEAVRPAILEGWSAHDPAGATQWLEANPAAKGGDYAAVTRAWAAQDPAATSEWLDRLPAGPNKNHAVAEFLQAGFMADPQAVMDWLGQISDPTWRHGITRELVSRWMVYDRDAAIRWVKGAKLPDDLRQDFLRHTR